MSTFVSNAESKRNAADFFVRTMFQGGSTAESVVTESSKAEYIKEASIQGETLVVLPAENETPLKYVAKTGQPIE